MRLEFALFQIEAGAPQRGFDFDLQMKKLGRRFGSRPQGMGLFIAEDADAGRFPDPRQALLRPGPR